MAEYDVVIIGGGMAGSTAGLFSARRGLSTVVLNSGLPGGQLLNIGKIEDFPGFQGGVVGFDLCPTVQEQALEAGASFEMVEAKELAAADRRWMVHTTGDVFDAGAVIIATGSRARALGIPGEEHLIDNGGFLELQRLPKRILLVGGGYIAAEFSHIAARTGAQVVILQRGKRMLKHFDPDLVGWLMEKFHGLGIDVRTQAAVTSTCANAAPAAAHRQTPASVRFILECSRSTPL